MYAFEDMMGAGLCVVHPANQVAFPPPRMLTLMPSPMLVAIWSHSWKGRTLRSLRVVEFWEDTATYSSECLSESSRMRRYWKHDDAAFWSLELVSS